MKLFEQKSKTNFYESYCKAAEIRIFFDSYLSPSLQMLKVAFAA